MKQPSLELIELCGAVRDNTATAEQVARLEALLAADASARRFYRQFIQITALLERYEAPTARAFDPTPVDADGGGRRLYLNARQWLALAACFLLLATGYFIFGPASRYVSDEADRTAESVPVAFVQDPHDSLVIPRAGPAGPARDAVQLGAGDILATSASGGAALRFRDEHTLFILAADTRIWLSHDGGSKILHLTSGQIYCDISPQKEGSQWRIITADGEAKVLGTQLAVSANTAGTRVAVTSGRVEVTARDSRERVDTRAGYAAEITPTTARLVKLSLQEPTRVISFTVVDADTNLPLAGFETLADGAVLNFTALPTRRLNIRANCAPQLVGAVRFTIIGVDSNGSPLQLSRPPASADARPWESFPSQIEFMYPYMLAGDPSLAGRPLSSHSNAWTPPIGRYTLTAVPYAIKKDEGARGESLSVQFEVIDTAR